MIIITGMIACDKDVTDFGNDATFSGKVKDQAGNVVPSTTTSNTLMVQALGENDQITTDIRIKGDGSFQNTKLFPKKYKIWISGPARQKQDTLFIDFGSNKQVMQDIVVEPFIALKTPGVVGSPTTNSATISFDMAANAPSTVSKRELYCSTVTYPDGSTGSGPYYDTKKLTLATDKGTISVTGLSPKTTYYVRIGAQANGAAGFNFSEQISFQTP